MIESLRREVADLLAGGRPEAALEALARAAAATPDGELAAEIDRLRTAIAESTLGQAERARRAGQLELAVGLAERAISARPDPPVRERVIDLARRLGLDLYAAGELVRARAIWRAALALDAGDELLLRYLEEVGSRLESLERIRGDGPPGC